MLVERHRGVEQEIFVVDAVHAAVTQHFAHVVLQVLADKERMLEALHEVFFLGREAIGVGGVDGGEEGVAERILFSFERNGTLFQIHAFQQGAVAHAPFRVCFIELSFQFELYDCYGLVHLRKIAAGLFVGTALGVFELGHEYAAGIGVGIGFHGKGGKRQHVDAVALFERLRIGVAQ